MVGQLRDVKELGGHAAHEVAGAVFVVEAEGEGLKVGEEILADIGLHQHAEGMAPVADDVLHDGAEEVGEQQNGDDREEGCVAALRNELVHADSGDKGEGQVDNGYGQGADHIHQKELHMRAEVADKDAQQALPVEIAGCHEKGPPFL